MASQVSFTLRGRNPDVLTCIANLSNDEVFTPPELANGMLDMLAEAWAADHGGASLCHQGMHASNDHTDACGGAVIDKCQTAMNMAAIVGPRMKPLMPNTAMPPSVVIITT